MTYESTREIESQAAPGVRYRVARMSFGRRIELMRRIRELSRRMEYLEAGREPGEKMDAGLLRVEIERLYLEWGLLGISGLVLDGEEATPQQLAEAGPEELFREAVAAVRSETGLTESERKN